VLPPDAACAARCKRDGGEGARLPNNYPSCDDSSRSWNGTPGSEPVQCSDNLWGWFWVTFPLPLKNFFCTLQFWWFVVAAASYVYLNPLFGGDNFKRAASFEADWIGAILLRNLGLTVVYYEFWHHTLYCMKLADRKFKPSWPTTSVVMRNRFWTCMGAIQWSAWEVMYAHMFATGRLVFMSDDAIMASWNNAARFVLWTLFTPIYRQVHFYFIHRLLHIRPLYKYVHSLHHKNTDPEPWSGLCMHPIEHLFYYSCSALPLIFLQHPFHVFYNGQHAMLSPAEAHSGFEDHNGADLMHYIHHAKFECSALHQLKSDFPLCAFVLRPG
jgi:sterol desaturase/sphingolipid hydroxylase (fatty acid hydroxylase superfamily)